MEIRPIPLLKSSVGATGSGNFREDIAVVQELLNALPYFPKLLVSGNNSQDLVVSIKAFQTKYLNQSNPSGVIYPRSREINFLREYFFRSGSPMNWSISFRSPRYQFFFDKRLPNHKRAEMGEGSKFLINSLADYFGRNLKVTSLRRFPEEQARIMIGNVLDGGDGKERNLAKQLDIYGDNGDIILDKINKLSENMARSMLIAKITDEIDKMSRVGKLVSLHVVNKEAYAKLNVIDIGLSSFQGVPLAIVDSILTQLKGRGLIQSYLNETPKLPCFHLVIPQPLDYKECTHFFSYC